MVSAKRILIIEDDSKISSGVKIGLENYGYVADIAYDGTMGKSLALSELYDLIVLDSKIPVLNGFQLCSIIRENNELVPIMMLSVSEDLNNKLQGFECGIDDYLSIPFEFKELLARVKVMLKRAQQKPLQDGRIKVGDLEIDRNAKTIIRGGNTIELSSKEYNILEYLALNQGKVVSRPELIEKVWEKNLDLSSNVVDVYINFLRNKMDNGYTTQLIQTRVGLGYVLKDNSKDLMAS